jgi:hypothetical protein
MQWLKNKWFAHQYYKITEEGDQVSIYDSQKAHYILHIQNEGQLYYHFIVPGSSYRIETPYDALGLSIELNKSYLLPPKQFMIKGNQLGSPVFLKWLCKHYLGISMPEKSMIHCIDQDANLYSGTTLYVDNTLKKDIK